MAGNKEGRGDTGRPFSREVPGLSPALTVSIPDIRVGVRVVLVPVVTRETYANSSCGKDELTLESVGFV